MAVPAGTWYDIIIPSVFGASVSVSQKLPPRPLPSAAVVFVGTAGAGFVLLVYRASQPIIPPDRP